MIAIKSFFPKLKIKKNKIYENENCHLKMAREKYNNIFENT